MNIISLLKILFSLAVTEGIGYQKGRRHQGKKIGFIDIKRAYLHAPSRRKVYIELPDEDKEEGKCGYDHEIQRQ